MSKKISELTAAASVAGTDLVVIVDGSSTTKRATVTQVGAAIGAASTPTGDGFPHVTAGTQDAAATALTFTGDTTGTGTGASIALTTGKLNGIAASGTPAIGNTLGATSTSACTWSALNLAGGSGYITGTLPVGNGGTGITSLGTGVATLLGATPTGTSGLVGSTSPTFRTGILLNNPANTFAYTFTPAAIAAARTITLPLLTGNDTMVTAAFAQALTNKTIVAASNTITDTSATLGDILKHDGTRFVRLARGSANQVLTVNAGGTDIAWAAAGGGGGSPGGSTTQVQFNDAGAFAGDAGMTYDKTNDVLTLAGAVVVGTTPAGAGSVRLASAGTIAARNAANSDNIGLIGLDASDELYIGSDSAFTPTKTALYTDVSSRLGTYFRISGTTTQLTDASFIKTAIPTIGYGAPYGSHGAVTYAFASNANYTLTAAEYVYDWISFNVGAWTAGRTVTFPNVASLDAAYTKTVFNNTGFTMTISNGGTTKTLATGLAQRFLFGVSAVSFASPTWTP